MYWTEQHNNSILRKEVVFENPYIHEKTGLPSVVKLGRKL